jgi:hypothetical protein
MPALHLGVWLRFLACSGKSEPDPHPRFDGPVAGISPCSSLGQFRPHTPGTSAPTKSEKSTSGFFRQQTERNTGPSVRNPGLFTNGHSDVGCQMPPSRVGQGVGIQRGNGGEILIQLNQTQASTPGHYTSPVLFVLVYRHFDLLFRSITPYLPARCLGPGSSLQGFTGIHGGQVGSFSMRARKARFQS